MTRDAASFCTLTYIRSTYNIHGSFFFPSDDENEFLPLKVTKQRLNDLSKINYAATTDHGNNTTKTEQREQLQKYHSRGQQKHNHLEIADQRARLGQLSSSLALVSFLLPLRLIRPL